MKFKNKLTQEVVEAKGYTQEFAYNHNSNWEKITEDNRPKTLTILEIKSKLDELGIEYNHDAKKEDLIALLPKE